MPRNTIYGPDQYLRRYARQNHDNGSAKTFVAVSATDPRTILGYYSISPSSIPPEQIPGTLRKGLGRYDVGVYRLARLAVALPMRGQNLGADLLMAAGRKALIAASQVGGIALAIDAKDDGAARWYGRFGATPLSGGAPLKLILSLDSFAATLGASIGRHVPPPPVR